MSPATSSVADSLLGHARSFLFVPADRLERLDKALASDADVRALEAVPLGALIRLRVDTRLDRPSLVRLSGPTAIMPAEDVVYRARLGRRLGHRIGLFQDLTRLATLVPVFGLTRTGNPEDLPDQVRLVVSVMTGGR